MRVRLEQQGTQGRGQRQGHDAREHHGHRDGDGELLVHLARQTAHEGHGDEHGAEHQHDGDDRGRDLAHGLGRSFLGRQVLGAHDAFHVLQHHDGVVHHDTDGQHHAEQGQGVDGVAQGVHAREGTDDGHGHGDAGDEGGAPALQEDEDHDEHQDHGFHQGMDHFIDGFHDEFVGVHDDLVGHPFGEVPGQLLEAGGDGVAGSDGIGAGQQVDAHGTGHHAVVFTADAVVLAAHLDAGHVLEAQHGAVLAGADDDLAEFLGRVQAALGVDLPGKLGRVGHGRVAQTAGRELRVLLLDGRRDLAHGDAVLGQLVRDEPDAHGIVHVAEHGHVAHAGHALEFVGHVHLHVVVQVHGVVTAVRRVQGDDLQHGRRTLDHGHTLQAHGLGQGALGQVDLVVDVDQGHVRVGAQTEIDVDGALTGSRGGRGRHIEHVFHAVDVHFQGGQHGAGDGLGRGAGIEGRHVDRGRHQFRILGDGQGLHGQRAHQGDHDGDDRRKDRSAQEDIWFCRSCHGPSPTSERSSGRPAPAGPGRHP